MVASGAVLHVPMSLRRELGCGGIQRGVCDCSSTEKLYIAAISNLFKCFNITMGNNTAEKFGFLNLMVFVLSIYVLGALIVDTAFKLSPETSRLLNYIDMAICVFFF